MVLSSIVVITILAVGALLTACASHSKEAPPQAWRIDLSGARNDTLAPDYYGKLKALSGNYLEKTVEKKGSPTSYRGIPLKAVLAIIDGTDAAHPFVFDQGRWNQGYDVTLTAEDGYSATFSSLEVGVDALILADTENGVRLQRPMVVGDAGKSLWVKDLASIEIHVGPSALSSDAGKFSLQLDINGTRAEFTLDQLEKDADYIEGTGSFTTSAGTKYTNVYGGVRLAALLKRYMILSPDDSITFIATDGYEMTYPGSRILDQSDGEWILAFRMDGEYLPKDPGYIRTVKIGKDNPNIDGHLSVKMISKIVVKEKDFVDFSLKISGKLNMEIDRSTVQSCISCHGKDVEFERKGISGTYTGIPLYLLLAYADDPDYAPHRQDSKIISYNAEAAQKGYKVEITADDGFAITLDSRDLHGNGDIIVGMYKNQAILDPTEFPLVLVWDKAAEKLPEGIKNVKRVEAIRLTF
jgi:hypothetical protein